MLPMPDPTAPGPSGPDRWVASLQAEVDAVRAMFHAEVRSAAERVSSLERVIDEQRGKIARLETDRARLEVTIAEISVAHDGELGRLEGNFAQERNEALDLRRSLTERLRTARGELTATRQYIGSLLENEQRLVQEARSAEERATRLAHELAEARSALAMEQDAARAQAEQTAIGYSRGEARVAELEATISDLLNSRSWRTTRPLRWVMHRLRGGQPGRLTPQ